MEKALGPDHPRVVTLLENLGDYYQESDQKTEEKSLDARPIELL
jgi:hypothetical protein